jgi:hypothetical protein
LPQHACSSGSSFFRQPYVDLNPSSLAVSGINCHGPTAPTHEVAVDFSSDSITAEVLQFLGRLYFTRMLSDGVEIRLTPGLHLFEVFTLGFHVIFYKAYSSCIQFDTVGTGSFKYFIETLSFG